MLVGQGVSGGLNLRDGVQDLLAHLVHGGLDAGTVVLGEDLQSDIAGRLPGLIELGDSILNGLEIRKGLPLPGCIDIG